MYLAVKIWIIANAMVSMTNGRINFMGKLKD